MELRGTARCRLAAHGQRWGLKRTVSEGRGRREQARPRAGPRRLEGGATPWPGNHPEDYLKVYRANAHVVGRGRARWCGRHRSSCAPGGCMPFERRAVAWFRWPFACCVQLRANHSTHAMAHKWQGLCARPHGHKYGWNGLCNANSIIRDDSEARGVRAQAASGQNGAAEAPAAS